MSRTKPKDGYQPVRKDLIKLCLKHEMPAVALTDKGNLFGALEFGMAAAEAGVQPIIGCQIAVLRDEQAGLKTMTRDGYDQLVLLVQNEQGYRNLSALVTLSFVEKDRAYPYVTAEELARYTEGLIALSCGTEGEVGRLLLGGQAEAADLAAQKYAGLFPNRFYIEITRHHGGTVGANEQRIEHELIELAYKHNIPLVATNDVYFGEPDMYDAHDALLCIADKMIVAETNRRHLTRDHYFKSAAEMRTLFADLPEACDNTLVIAHRCAYMPPERKPILPAFPTAKGRSEEENSAPNPKLDYTSTQLADGTTLADHLEVRSAGTGPWHEGEPMHPLAQDTLLRAGYPDDSSGPPDRVGRAGRLRYPGRPRPPPSADPAQPGRRPRPPGPLRSFDPAAGAAADVPDPYYGETPCSTTAAT